MRLVMSKQRPDRLLTIPIEPEIQPTDQNEQMSWISNLRQHQSVFLKGDQCGGSQQDIDHFGVGRWLITKPVSISDRKYQDPSRENRVLSDRPTQKPTILVYKTAQRSRESPGIDQRMEFSLEIVQVSTSCLIWVLGALKERQVVLIKILH